MPWVKELSRDGMQAENSVAVELKACYQGEEPDPQPAGIRELQGAGKSVCDVCM